MRINIFLVLAIVGAFATIAFFIGKNQNKQVTDSDGKFVKGNFLTTDGVTATLQNKK